ncbi:Csu type fimbrial protein [Pantoea eucalypti]|jgi:spore coat protein U-like protein|uniref:Csu type fimbrial protein n=1 Tax=Pantoea TaxID=53335 RepID=UPI0002A6790E|nr:MULTISPECIES: spore coat U domain-containing protein [Pantoea]ELP26713.1 Sigma-fimbriae tip adhesin [Pantoea agglomerans 299R]MBD9553402.1 spore coat U domain-containing protein [Pantoea sp. PNT01]MDJ0474450.1 spore coat U domain-containing protein [Pantoea eucalypti]QXG55180.1 spore coat U domain-containing protein [Pantoea jilinensis]
MIKSLLLAALLLTLPSLSYAACGLPASTASFGSVTTFVANTTVSSVTTNANVNCGAGSALSLLGNNQITFQLTGATNISGTRGVLKRSGDTGSDNVPVRLCTDSACASELTIGSTPFVYSSQTLINLAGLLGSLNFALPVYLRTVPGQVVAAGTYSVTLNMAVTYRICTSIGVGNLCLSEQQGSGVIPINVTAVLTNDCTTITAPNISFGSAPLVSSFSAVSQTINVLCSKGSTYTVGLNNGSYPAGSVRNMASGANRLSYEIYKSATSNRWGAAGTERWSSTTSTAVSADGLTRGFNYTARILTTQNTPPAGNYSDSVVVDLSF